MDSHRGFPVLGTFRAFFEHFRYGDQQPLHLEQGKVFEDLFNAGIGAEVAKGLGYRLGQHVTLAHGTGELNLADHADKPFKIIGLLAPTGTPLNRTVPISLEAMEALRGDWLVGAPIPRGRIRPEEVRRLDLQPKAVTAAFMGLHSRAAVFSVQRQVNRFPGEPLISILPGVALDELWGLIGAGEKALLMSALVAAVSMAELVSVVLAGLNERRRELAVLRGVGASPCHVVMLLALEGLMVTATGIVLGIAALVGALIAAGPWLKSAYGLTAASGAADRIAMVADHGLAGRGLADEPAARMARIPSRPCRQPFPQNLRYGMTRTCMSTMRRHYLTGALLTVAIPDMPSITGRSTGTISFPKIGIR